MPLNSGASAPGGVAFKEASANIDPEAWRIVDGKLFLFSGKEGLEEDFDAKAPAVLAKADAEWPAVEMKEFETRAAANSTRLRRDITGLASWTERVTETLRNTIP